MAATLLWSALCLATSLLVPGKALSAAVEVDARSAHRAVWKVYGAGKVGTAFAIGDRHFVTAAHVIKGFADHGATEVFLDRRGSNDSRRLRVNYGHVALTLIQDIALFTTKERVDRYFALATGDTMEGETGLRAMGYPRGRPLESMRQTAPIPFHDEVWYEIPVDREVEGGGFSGGPFFDAHGKVVGMLTHAGGNMVAAVKVGVVRKFLDGDLPRTACRDHPSVSDCIERATRQARELAEAGDRVAHYQLGRYSGHLDKDSAMLRRAAENGFILAQNSLGSSLKDSERWAEAARWFRRSAQQGHPVGLYQLGLAHYRGRGVTRDHARAFELTLRAARSGHAIAEYGVGLSYQRGEGTARDVAKARRWFQRAAENGVDEAREKLKALSAAPTDGAFESVTVMWALKRSNVRTGPGTNFAKIGLLEMGDRVRVVERTGDWFRLTPQPGQTERYVYAPLLSQANTGM
ncbi:MAG: trypsin-like peptidase domain-containing protein [Rhodospirillales bacterium]|nr:trypsin-like peptidase domain-containing protein [Rhodospirillales bacterium]